MAAEHRATQRLTRFIEEYAGEFHRFYTESRIQFFVNILPSDIEKAYEEDRDRWGEDSVYEVWETIRSELLQTSYRNERERWLSTLKDRYDLVVYGVNGGLDQ